MIAANDPLEQLRELQELSQTLKKNMSLVNDMGAMQLVRDVVSGVWCMVWCMVYGALK